MRRREEYQEGDGAGRGWGRWGGGGAKIVKGMERDESGKQGMGEDRDGGRRGGIMRGKEVENDSPVSPNHSTLVARHQNVHPLLAY